MVNILKCCNVFITIENCNELIQIFNNNYKKILCLQANKLTTIAKQTQNVVLHMASIKL